MLKSRAKSLALGIGISLMSIVNANAMFQACYIDTGFKSVTFKQMQKNVNFKKMQICYQAALCLAKAEGNLETPQIDYLLSKMIKQSGANNYSDEFKEIMNIPPTERLKTRLVSRNAVELHEFGLDSIRESGFINFQRIGHDNNIFHTVYVQVTTGGKKIIYNANNLEFTLSLDYEKKSLSIGKLASYAVLERNGIETGAVEAFNNYISRTSTPLVKTGFHFTPVTDVSKNIFSKMQL